MKITELLNESQQGVAEGSNQYLVYISKSKVREFEEWMESEGLETEVPKKDVGEFIVYDYSGQDVITKSYADDWNEKGQGVAEDSVNEVSSAYLQRAQADARDKYNLAAASDNNLPDSEAQALMRFYGEKEKKFKAGAKAKQEQEARSRALKKINPSAVAMRKAGIAEPLAELSPKTLASYKKKAGAQASELDKRAFHKDTEPKQAKQDIAKANKRFSGIVRATKKEFGK